MGLPQLDFRVPEATWFKSVLAGKFGVMPGLSATGTLAWPYKIAVVAVMTLVAGGTLVTFGSAGAETPASSEVAALPGSDEASPTVEGQVLPPPATSLLNSADLMSSLNLTDFSPEGADLSLSDDDDETDEDSDDNGDEDNESTTKKKSSSKPKPTPTSSSGSGSDDGGSDGGDGGDGGSDGGDGGSDGGDGGSDGGDGGSDGGSDGGGDGGDDEPTPEPTKTCKWEGDNLLSKKWVCS